MEQPEMLLWKKTKLWGVWHQSSNSDAPIVIFHHGFGGNKTEAHRIFVKCARELAEKGLNTFRFDFYGSGDSEGSLTDATLSVWIENALEAVSFVKSKKPGKIFLLGFSLGAFVAAAIAPKVLPEGLVLWAPIFHPLKRILREKTLMKEARISGFADYQGEVVKYTLVEDAASFKIPAVFQGYHGPVCLIHGDDDPSARPVESKKFARFYRGEGCDVALHTIPGANHTFDRHDWEAEVLALTLQWILQQG